MSQFDKLRGHALTPREQEVFDLIIAGLTGPEIKKKLWISEGTVCRHRQVILGKIGAKTMPHAVALYLTAKYKAQASAGVAY